MKNSMFAENAGQHCYHTAEIEKLSKPLEMLDIRKTGMKIWE